MDKVEEGFHAVSRDPVRLRKELDKLASGPRPYQNARDRLAAAGQFAAPLMLEYLQNNSKQELHPYIIKAMTEIGRPRLFPLIEELRVSDPGLKVELVGVIGQIGYPQALPMLRQMQMDQSLSADTQAAVTRAISMIDRTGRASSMSPAQLYVAGGENFYSKKASYQAPLADEKTNPVWYFDSGLNNVVAINVPTQIWGYVMAARSAESALKAEPSNADAISLWLAADLSREIGLPADAKDPSKSEKTQEGTYYARAAGPQYLNPVLGRALDNQDSALALRAIDALEATGGASGLVTGADSPLVRALGHADRAVRFHAAFALAKANPVSQFPSYYRVVPILAEAVSSSSNPTALLVVPDEDLRNALSDALHNSDVHFTVFAGGSVTAALDKARRSPSIDVVVVPTSEAARVAEISRSEYRLANAPVLVTAEEAQIPALKVNLASRRGYGVIDRHADAAVIISTMQAAQSQMGVAPISADDASKFSLQALELLGRLATDHRSIYAVNEAVPALTDALKDKRADVAAASAGVIGKLNSAEGQRALAGVALMADADPAQRVIFFTQLAESAKHTGNALDATTVNAIIKTVSSDKEASVRLAAAGALGALNVPSNQASTLILEQAR
ncbi:MAG TPA: hypothetical protein VHM90_04590 [Phycisphaerae bacterium]|nr:hypothetical protein [Phycisphaerae bacterium]